MRITIPLILIILLSYTSFSQSTIKGSIKDTADDINLQHAVFSIIKKSDSTLAGFTRVNAAGEFLLHNVPPGEYYYQVTFPKYADFMEELTVGNKPIDLKQIIMTPKSVLLEEVIVRQRIAAIRMKGDTLEFRADSFAVRTGASVEELLKKLPGIQVNKDGEITAQGEKVQKVLVDGEEFFSDDPAVVTQNLRADAVENVQVFDKKSDQATFTGIDDGEKTKTINLKLKADKKQGFFGKARLAGGTPSSFENEAMINLFRGKKKLAAFGTMANTGKAGLNWEDNNNFGQGSNMEYLEDEGYFVSYSESDEFNTYGGRYSGEGLPQAWTGGLHFSNKWNEDKNHINGNYTYYKQNINVEGNTISQYILPDTQYYNNEKRFTYNQNIRNKLNGFYDLKIDSSTSMKITVGGSQVKGISSASYEGESRDDDSSLVNTNERILGSDGVKNDFKSSMILRKKFRKKGRTISISLDQSYNDQDTDGLLQSGIYFYDPFGSPDSSVLIDQKKLNISKNLAVNSRIAYTEPLGKYSFLELNYGYRISNSEAIRESFNKSGGVDGKYDILDSLYSNNYLFRFNTHSTGLNFRVNKKKLNIAVGSNIAFADFLQKDNWADTSYTYQYTNLFPKASFRYNFKQQTRLSLNYNGSTRQPSLQQIQPIRDNSNTLNIQIGNPLLKQQFNHNISLQFNDFKVLSGRSLWVSAGYNMTDNAISTSSYISKGVRTTQFVNVSGNYSMNFWGGYWVQIKKYNINIGLNGGGNIARQNNFIDSMKNTNSNSSINMSLNVGYHKEKSLSFFLRPGIDFVTSKSSLNPETITRYWLSNNEVSFSYELPRNFEISSEVDFAFRQKTAAFSRDVNAIKWNASVSKKFWKNRTGEIKLSVFDILDQNIGFERNASSNFISENTYNTIRRFWLIGFTWNFSKNPSTGETK